MPAVDWRYVQSRLTELGFDPGSVDGLDGPKTRAGVRAFQNWHNDQLRQKLAVDGIAGPRTLAALRLGRKGKRIVVFCDGTWNSPYIKQPTHVHQLFKATADSDRQVAVYFPGVGTGGKLRTGIGKLLNKIGGGAFGWGLDAKIKEAYGFIAGKYEPDDEILIFGFSRGAYTARSLAGMIRKAGIVSDASDKKKINEAFALYRKAGPDNAPDKTHIWQQRRALSPSFATSSWDLAQRGSGSHLVRISYLGIWDTVGALGIPEPIFGPIAKLWNTRFRFHDTVLSKLTRSARHAVAIDERRQIFEAALWSNLETTPGNKGLNGDETGKDRPYQQVWFVGDHGTVGGSGSNRGLTSISLDWIARGALRAGLELEPGRKFPESRPDPLSPGSELHKSGPGGGPKKWRSGPAMSRELSETAEQRLKRFPGYRPKNLSALLGQYYL